MPRKLGIDPTGVPAFATATTASAFAVIFSSPTASAAAPTPRLLALVGVGLATPGVLLRWLAEKTAACF